MGLRDVDQLRVEHAGEGEQVVALVLQRDAHGANTSDILRLPAPRYELRQISVSATITWRSHVGVTVNRNGASSSDAADMKASSNAAEALCACW
jgi:hypothetical protein